MDEMDRRRFLRRAAGTVGLALVPPSLGGLVLASGGCGPRESGSEEGGTGAGQGAAAGGYGDPVDRTGIMALPRDFEMRDFGAIGDPMSDGNPTPVALDGMAAFAGTGGTVRLLRNHEDRNGPVGRPIAAENAYDPAAGGGVVTLVVGPDRTLLRDFVSLNGTAVNCAGGPTPWGSWLSCEETVVGRSEGYERRHGFVFEVPASARGPVEPRPLVEMGRFSHEAVAVDPATGILYLTEDNAYEPGDPSAPGSGFYRFLPARPGALGAGGELQMARVRGHPELEIFRGREIGLSVGDVFEVDWVDVPHPEPDPGDELSEDERLAAVFRQGRREGAVAFARLEGCWYGDGSVFFHDTEGGAERCGQVWQYVPDGRGRDAGGRLVLVFESPGRDVLDGPDNITVSPRGGLVICEDGDGSVQHLRGLTRDGEIFDFGANVLNGSELAGATFGPDGRTLYVNIQGPTSGTPEDAPGEGRTVAVWGPWERGAL